MLPPDGKRLIDRGMFQKLTSSDVLPPLNRLRAFEAMGRLGSATRAGAELSVTHSAVSRQVKALEAALGMRLFEGPKSKLELTREGQALLAGLTPAFDALTEAVRAVRPVASVRIAVHNSLAVKWLIPRLPEFERRQPGVAIELRDLPIEAVRARDADLVVRFLDGPRLDDPGVEHLAANRIGLVVAPDMADRLAVLPRLVARSHPRGWDDWDRITGSVAVGARLRTLPHLHHVLDAATSGLGVAVLPWILVKDAVQSQTLSAPFGFVADGGQVVAITMSTDATLSVKRTLSWLRELASAMT